jgi:hypothetical protein
MMQIGVKKAKKANDQRRAERHHMRTRGAATRLTHASTASDENKNGEGGVY